MKEGKRMKINDVMICNIAEYQKYFDFEKIWNNYQIGVLSEWLETQWLNSEQQFLKNIIIDYNKNKHNILLLLHYMIHYYCCIDNDGIENIQEQYNKLHSEYKEKLEKIWESTFSNNTSSVDYDGFVNMLTQALKLKIEEERYYKKWIELHNSILNQELSQEETLSKVVLIFSLYKLANKDIDNTVKIAKTFDKKNYSNKENNKKLMVIEDLARELKISIEHIQKHVISQEDFNMLLMDNKTTEICLWPTGNCEYTINNYNFEYTKPLKIVTKKIVGYASKDYGNIKIKVLDRNGNIQHKITLQSKIPIYINTINGDFINMQPRVSMGDFQMVYIDKEGKRLIREEHVSPNKMEMSVPEYRYFSVGNDKTTAIIKSDGKVRFYTNDYTLNSYNNIVCQNGEAVQVCVLDSNYLILKSSGEVESNMTNVDWKEIISIALTHHGIAVGLKANGKVICNNKDQDLSRWENVISITAAYNYIAGITSTGRVLLSMSNPNSIASTWINEIESWSRVKGIVLTKDYMMGLDLNGKIYYVGTNSDLKEKFENKINISELHGSSAGIAIIYDSGDFEIIK